MKERVLAIFGAVALIAAAFVVRSLIVGGDGGGSSESAGSGGSSGRPVVACTKDLMAMCDALEADGAIASDPPTVELGSDGAKAGTVDDVDLDGWITWDPAPALANFDASSKGGGSVPAWQQDVLVLSTDELAIVGSDDAISGLQKDCDATWDCIAASDLAVGTGEPATAQGIARVSALAVPFAEDLDPATLDGGALKELLDGPVNGQSPLTQQLTAITRPGQLGLVVGPRSLLDRTAATSQGKAQRLRVATPGPATTISVVLAISTRSDRDLSGLLDDVRSDALSDTRAVVGMTAPPGDTVNQNLAGFLYQVRERVG